MGEGRPKTVEVVVMPAVVAIAITHSRKMTPAHEGRGSSLPPLPLQPRQRQQVQIYLAATEQCQRQCPRNSRAGMRGWHHKGGGGAEEEFMSLSLSAAD